MNAKTELRREVREKLAAISSEEKAVAARVICLAISELPQWKAARTVAIFAPLHDEPDVELLWEKMRGEKKRAVYPRVEDSALAWFAVENRASLTANRWRLREPARDAASEIAVSEIDLMLVPGVAFSLHGGRLGRGGGFYDRTLANHELRAFKIGVCFAAQVVAELPSELHDREVDLVISD